MSNSTFEINPDKQYILAGDISASMQSTDCKDGATRYAYMLEKFKQFLGAAAEYDTDGVSVYLFGQSVHAYPDTTLASVESALANPSFEPMTRTDLVIKAAFDEHKAKGDSKGTVLILFTDGAPSSKEKVQNEIIEITKNIQNREEFSLIFVTVGEIADDLRAFLTGLDDDLKGAAFDIVDVKEIGEVDFFAAVAGAQAA
jgi:hypothetical protein